MVYIPPVLFLRCLAEYTINTLARKQNVTQDKVVQWNGITSDRYSIDHMSINLGAVFWKAVLRNMTHAQP